MKLVQQNIFIAFYLLAWNAKYSNKLNVYEDAN